MINPRKSKSPITEATFGEKLFRLCHAVANEMSLSLSIVVCLFPFAIAAVLWKKFRRRRLQTNENKRLPDIPWAVPPLPPTQSLRRNILKQKIIDVLVRNTYASTHMGVHFILGREGTGRSTIVSAAARSLEVRQCFRGGIAWIDASRKWGDCGNEGAAVSLLRQYREIQRQLNVRSADLRDPFVAQNWVENEGTKHLDSMLEVKDLMAGVLSDSKPILLVVENLQTREDLKWWDFSVSGGTRHHCLIIMNDESLRRILPPGNFTDCNRVKADELLLLISQEAQHPAVLQQKSLKSFQEIASMSACLPVSAIVMGRSMAFQASRGDAVPAVSLLGAIKTSCSVPTCGLDELMKALDGIVTCIFREEAAVARLCFTTLVSLWGKGHPKEWFPVYVVDMIFKECCAIWWLSGLSNEEETSQSPDSCWMQALKGQGIRIQQLFAAIGLLKTSRKGQCNEEAICCQITHDSFRQYGHYIYTSQKELSVACEKATNAFLTKMIEVERSPLQNDLNIGTRVFVRETLPYHLIVSGRLEDAELLLQRQQFCYDRFRETGFVASARLHMADSEELYLRCVDGSTKVTSISPSVLSMKKAYAAVSACLSGKFLATTPQARRKIGKVLYEMGLSLLSHGSRANALKYFEDAIAIQREAVSESYASIGRTIKNFGVLYVGRKDNKLSKKYFEISETVSEGFSVDTLERITELFVGAESRQKTNDEDSGLWFYKEQLWIRMQELVDGPIVDLSRSLLTTCCVHYSNDDCDEAIDLMDTAIQVYFFIGFPEEHSSIKFLLKCKEKAEKLMFRSSK
uniref:Uncharacterized protein n=1 Tax=Odontella aurita TaxID=265563 RepID=A0A7S4N007_9STRA|mmetsp:Transcript_41928/g.127140  ORF Transcript_41928/g.127140 Transcript_41928/m.127140 type:complete len:802 (+) Transcript_41928:178-2583(+)|eukprot:CAMPEP_0113529960 /NCGR_PEP_ID=MMETSP0015_2-20120614/2677_1 /TAXON_ID=2838 /ORGANISM="Odontella" /LENGTH=801 /DNA_ID=CAMNT_0000428635 /DNA_START=114 /DNA_END=2519 /DNA_ORIENTATION=+ /assembly_acc=CAM_ASM_000160